MRVRKQVQLKGKPKFAVLVDGETEFWYLQMLKRNEKLIKVDIKPEIPQKKKLADQYKKVIELSNDYDMVFWIIDLDTVLSESGKAKKGGEKPIDVLLKYKKAIENEYKTIILIINQPCLEFWFLTHFVTTSKAFTDCDDAGKQLAKHLPNYAKTEKYFVKQEDDIYKKLRNQLGNAVARSSKMPAFDKSSPCNGFTEMYKLFEKLGVL